MKHLENIIVAIGISGALTLFIVILGLIIALCDYISKDYGFFIFLFIFIFSISLIISYSENNLK